MATTNSTTNTTSTTAYSYLQYKNKIGGLVSGMDIDSIMEKLMKAESAQMEKLQQQKQKYEWKRDAYRETNTKIDTFQKDLYDSYGLKGSWNAKTVSVSGAALTATATAAANGTLNVTEAKMATAGAKVLNEMADGATADSTIASLGLTDGSFEIQAVNENGTYTTKTINYTSTDKVSDIMNRINSSGVGVTAIVSGQSLSFTANVEGAAKDENGNPASAINIKTDGNGLFEKLGVISSQTGAVTSSANGGTDGESGYIVANGVKIQGNSNVYTVSGYKININQDIRAAEYDNTTSTPTLTRAADPAVKISSTTDTDKIVDKVKAFVASYNELIAGLNTSVSQKKNVSYPPLTDAQKAEMTTDQITKWEEKAKAGLLKGDSTLNNVISSMRSTLSTYGFGSNDTLAKIGITTSKTYTENGKLEIDEDKLKEALNSDPEIVSRIFTGDSATGSEGIVSKLRTTAQNAVKTIKNTAGSEASNSDVTYSLGKTITSLNTKIDDWKDRLKDIEERYWNQFSAMEKAIQKANSQSSIFMQ